MAKRGRPPAFSDEEIMRVVAEVERARYTLRRWRIRQVHRTHLARFEAEKDVAPKHADMRTWTVDRRVRSSKWRVTHADNDTLADVRAMLKERDRRMNRRLGGIHVAGRDFRVSPATRREAFDSAARRLSKRWGRPVTSRAVEREYKKWRSWLAKQSDYEPSP